MKNKIYFVTNDSIFWKTKKLMERENNRREINVPSYVETDPDNVHWYVVNKPEIRAIARPLPDWKGHYQ